MCFCDHLRPLTTTCDHLRPLTTIYDQLRLLATTYDHLRPLDKPPRGGDRKGSIIWFLTTRHRSLFWSSGSIVGRLIEWINCRVDQLSSGSIVGRVDQFSSGSIVGRVDQLSSGSIVGRVDQMLTQVWWGWSLDLHECWGARRCFFGCSRAASGWCLGGTHHE